MTIAVAELAQLLEHPGCPIVRSSNMADLDAWLSADIRQGQKVGVVARPRDNKMFARGEVFLTRQNNNYHDQ
jgi:hypothetical protein